MEQVNINRTGKNVYFTIMDYVRLNGKLPNLNISKQARNRYIKTLKIDGILNKKGYGVWSIDEDKLKDKTSKHNDQVTSLPFIKSNMFTSRDIRSHGYVFKLRLREAIDWPVHLKKLGKTSELKYNKQRIIFREHKIHLCKRSIIIYFNANKSYYNDTAQEGLKQALYELEQILIGLENEYQVTLRIGNKFKVSISRQHYAKVKDDLARLQRESKDKLYIHDKGELWLISDYSLKEDETETVHRKEAPKDMDMAIKPFLNSVRHNAGFTLDEIRNMFGEVMKDRLFFADNLKSHVTAIQQLAHGVQLLNQREARFKAAQAIKEQRKINEY
jgi:hypothetical protein